MKGLIEAIDAENLKSEVPEFNVGDTVKVGYKIIEGGKERVQNFEGVVIAKKNGGIQESFTVRHISYGIGVEKTYPLHSPKIAAITVVRKGKVRRAKLYYLRDLTGKAAKVKELSVQKDHRVVVEQIDGKAAVTQKHHRGREGNVKFQQEKGENQQGCRNPPDKGTAEA